MRVQKILSLLAKKSKLRGEAHKESSLERATIVDTPITPCESCGHEIVDIDERLESHESHSTQQAGLRNANGRERAAIRRPRAAAKDLHAPPVE